MTLLDHDLDPAADLDADPVARFGPIGARLRAPDEAVDLAGFAARLQARRLVVTLEGLAAHAADPGLPGRIRGAFGQSLAEATSPEALAGQPCSFDPPSGFEAMFRKQGRMTPGTDFPSPWVIRLAARRGDLDVAMTVFGLATEWLPAAAEALTAALVHRVDWAGPRRLFVPRRRILGRRVAAIDGAALVEGTGTREDARPGSPRRPPARFGSFGTGRLGRLRLRDPAADGPDGPARTGPALRLVARSPLVSSGAGAAEDPASLFTTLGRRLEGLARWHGLTLDEDWAAHGRALRTLRWTWDEVEPVAWPRGSRRQDMTIPMKGVLGRLAVEGPDLPALLPLFRIGSLVHVGADIAFGCGAYDLLEP